MEEKKSRDSFPSITEQLFGPKESIDKAEVWRVIFSPKSKAQVKEAAKAEESDKNKNCGTESSKTITIEEDGKNIENEKHACGVETVYNEQRTRQPCGLGSSLYYGGQDFYYPPEGTPSYKMKNDATQNEQEGANRGDWWQDSLYY